MLLQRRPRSEARSGLYAGMYPSLRHELYARADVRVRSLEVGKDRRPPGFALASLAPCVQMWAFLLCPSSRWG